VIDGVSNDDDRRLVNRAYRLATDQRATDLIYPQMPTCQNCGSFVTERYVRVFTPEQISEPRVCPHCPDMIRDGADVRQARSSRQTGD
jgi:hypothetical protein